MLVPLTYRLVIRERRVEADGVISLSMQRPGGRPLPRWEPGAHINVLLGNGLERHYSLSSDPADRSSWRIGVLREMSGRGGSAYIHGTLKAGDTITVGSPCNNFPMSVAPTYRFIAGGIGITPILPMIAKAKAQGSKWSLLYGGRSRGGMAFLDELRNYGDRVTVAPQDEVGFLDIAGLLGDPSPDVHVYVCGPEGLLQAVERQMIGWPSGCLHLERFAPKRHAADGPDEPFRVEFVGSGLTASVPAGRTILSVAEELGIPILSSCGQGVCGTCQASLLDGQADHRDSLLSPAEKSANRAILICVSRAAKGCPTLRLDL